MGTFLLSEIPIIFIKFFANIRIGGCPNIPFGYQSWSKVEVS